MSPSRNTNKSFPDFSQSKVLIVGDIMLDRYYAGSTQRISPEAPVPIVNVSNIEERAGGAANVAINAAMMGADVTLIGLVGKDEAAYSLRTQLDASGVKCRFVEVSGFDTITKLRVMSRNQQLLRLDFEKSFEYVDKQALLDTFIEELSEADVIVLSDYAKGTLSSVSQLIDLARKGDKPVVVDPKGDDFSKYRGATVITPNLSEFELICGASSNEDELSDKAKQCCANYNIDNVVLTRSENGMSIFSTDNENVHLPALAREVYDVTGAGDTVVSTLSCALAFGETLSDACEYANHAAGIVVGKLGTSFVTPTELAIAMSDRKSTDGGILNQEQIYNAVKRAQQKGERVVMTNGCFDILHSGHVSYLKEAAQLGDRLIVAVNSDTSVKQLKGEGRPINNAQRRMAVLAELASVDWVVEFSEETPQALIAHLLPDVLVKGGDYTVEQIAGATEVMQNGGQVKVLCFEQDVSTTKIISQIVDQQ